MTADNPMPPPGRKHFVVWVIVVAVIVVGTSVLGSILAGIEGLVAAATIATALGTLALAWQTFALAKATRKAVEESGDELEELKAQRGLLEKQADGIAAQAEATARLAESSSLGALAAARTRIDSVSPLIHTTVQMTTFLVFFKKDGTSWTSRPVTTADQWFEPQLKDSRFEVTIAFTLKNVGKAPANLSFGDTSTFLENVSAKKLTGVVIEPGQEWQDTYIAKIYGPEGVNQTEVRMPFTYEGILYAEMFDRIQWNGQITPLLLNDGIAKRSERVVNHSGAQVFRTYPSLEEPERIASQAQVIQNGPNA